MMWGMGARDVIETASKNSQFVVFGDTHHSFIPLWPMAENFDALKETGKDFYFIEQHYSLQPAIEQLARGEITPEKFRQIGSAYNDDDFWGHSEMADSVIAATEQGLRVVAFDTRPLEQLTGEQSAPPSQISGYPQDLLPAIQQAYSQKDSVSFDQRSAQAVATIAGDQGGVVWIGNRHINGTHLDGDAGGDFDAYLGNGTSRIAMFNDENHYAEYSSRQNMATKEVGDCAMPDQPDFIYMVAHDVGFATKSALDRGYNLGEMITADVPTLCYSTDDPRIIQPEPQSLIPAPPPKLEF